MTNQALSRPASFSRNAIPARTDEEISRALLTTTSSRLSERLIGLDADVLGLASCLEHEHSPTIAATFPGGSGRWEVRKKVFRQGGLPLELLVLTDVSRSLRDEERQAWQRLIRVIGHEINNSLAPIKSIAGSLSSLVQREPRPDDWETDLGRGLGVIATRAEALSRFMAAYAQLARLQEESR